MSTLMPYECCGWPEHIHDRAHEFGSSYSVMVMVRNPAGPVPTLQHVRHLDLGAHPLRVLDLQDPENARRVT